jgi:ATP-dependent helicase/nuclease subunit A
VHRLLQSLPDVRPNRRAAAARRFLAQPAHGLGAAQAREILEETLAVLDAPDFAAVFGPGSHAEVPIIGRVKAAETGQNGGFLVVSGQIDRLVVSETAVWIIDYKTNRPAPESEDQVPAVYLRQMAAYRAVLTEIYPDKPIRCGLLWTDDLRLMQLSIAKLAQHAP